MELLSALEKILRKGNHPSSCHGMQIAFFFAQKVTEKKFSAPFAASIQMSLLFRSCLPHVPRKRKFVFLQQVGKRDLNHCELKDDTNSACEDKQITMYALSVSPLSDSGVWWSLGDSNYGGTALLVKQNCSPISISCSLDQSDGSILKHEADGSVVLAEFPSFRLLYRLVPNNG
nr:DNA-(apurinic or apyrimidinic site) lyase-like [Physcomitrium patens]|eukprot:XP_024383071.1 DNA-(apurinic or apyrimidinic site) lyase-like [Physcomitrella patens]